MISANSRFYEHNTAEEILNFIKNDVSDQRYQLMQKQSQFVFKQYFSDLTTITRTVLEIINDRVFTQSARNYRDWNIEQNVQNPLFVNHLPPASDGFTAVILTYDRLESLHQVIKSVGDTPSLAQIIVVWNNQDKRPPHPETFPDIGKPIKLIKTDKNLLTNRFYPFEEIHTEAVLSMDDDIVMLTADELEFAYQVWREFPDRIVGFPSRYLNN